MKSPIIFSFIGKSHSGKTSSIEALLKYLKTKNFMCIALKHIHQEGFSIDQPGKNTWRFSQAGADIVSTFSQNESSILINTSLSSTKVLNWVQYISKDLMEDSNRQVSLLLEGFRDIGEAQILCVEKYDDIEPQLTPSVKILAGSICSVKNDYELVQKKIPIQIIDIISSPNKLCAFFNLE